MNFSDLVVKKIFKSVSFTIFQFLVSKTETMKSKNSVKYLTKLDHETEMKKRLALTKKLHFTCVY